jgi:prepilin-type N-terminal cleavage/methylation domain-containing protein
VISRFRGRSTADDGFTLIELVVVMAIGSIMMAIGAFTFVNYRNMSQERDSALQLQSFLRSASEQAISEGRTYCVALANGTPSSANRDYSLWQKACTSAAGGTQVLTRKTQTGAVSFSSTVTNPATPPACPASTACIYFYPRGTALPANVVVASSARSKTYTIRVEGLTARVYQG